MKTKKKRSNESMEIGNNNNPCKVKKYNLLQGQGIKQPRLDIVLKKKLTSFKYTGQ